MKAHRIRATFDGAAAPLVWYYDSRDDARDHYAKLVQDLADQPYNTVRVQWSRRTALGDYKPVSNAEIDNLTTFTEP